MVLSKGYTKGYGFRGDGSVKYNNFWYVVGVNGGVYLTLSDFFTYLIRTLEQYCKTNKINVLPFGGVWSGKSLFNGVLYLQDVISGFYSLTFQNLQENKSVYKGDYNSTTVSYIGIA